MGHMSDLIRMAADEIRSHNAVAVVGAGISLGQGLPLTRQLQPMLWDAVDADPVVQEDLRRRFSLPAGMAKEMLGDDLALRYHAYQAIAGSAVARQKFQSAFAELDRERASRPSPAHDALAELLHRRTVEFVVSLNWDTLLEAAYHRRYGSTLRPDGDWLYKPHGDAARPEECWSLPHERGSIADNVVERVRRLTEERPRTLLIVGYSESDEAVVQKLTGPLAGRWRVVRIGPAACGDLSIPVRAEEALPQLARAIHPFQEVPGWEYVSFDVQNDLAAALSGRRLGPSDVRACPRLPEVETVKRQLLRARSSIIVSESGNGKSVTAYQAAFDLSREGWEVLRLDRPFKSGEGLLDAVRFLPRPTLLFVDDAQTVDPGFQRRLMERADARTVVLVADTMDSVGSPDGVRIDGKRAARYLASAFAERPEQTLKAVQAFDQHVGERYLDIPLERRLAEAAKAASPWQFTFILTGGWNRADNTVTAAAAEDRADLILATVAATQIATLDSDVLPERVVALSSPFCRPSQWVGQSIKVLTERKTLLGKLALRCPHYQMARVVLALTFQEAEDGDRERLCKMLRLLLTSDETPLLGVSWLLQELDFCLEYRAYLRHGLIDERTWGILRARCWNAKTPLERRDAMFALNSLEGWRPDYYDEIRRQSPVLGEWLQEATPDSAGALGRMINDLGNEDKSLVRAICDSADPATIARSAGSSALANAYAWGWLLGRLAYAAPEEWKHALTDAMDAKAFRQAVVQGAARNLSGTGKLIEGVWSLDEGLTLDLVTTAAPFIGKAISQDPAGASRDLGTLLWTLPYLARTRPAMLRSFRDEIDIPQMAEKVSASKRRDWQDLAGALYCIRKVMPDQIAQLVAAIDTHRLDEAADGLWGEIPHELHVLLGALSLGRTKEPARGWIARHAYDLHALRINICLASPKVAVDALRRGAKLVLDIYRAADMAQAINRMANVDPAVTEQALADQVDAIADAISSPQAGKFLPISELLATLERRFPEVVRTAFGRIDAEKAAWHWSASPGEARTKRLAVRRLIEIANRVGYDIEGLFEPRGAADR